jgi:hypothetical protein
MAQVLFYTATAAQYAALETKNDHAIYFITDTGDLFKGSVPFSFPCRLVETFPASGDKGYIYVGPTGTMKVWTGSAWLDVGAEDNFLSAAQRHVVTAAEAGTGMYTGIDEGDVGVIFTMRDNETMYVSLGDLVDIYTADNSGSNAIAVTVAGYTIGADLKVSTEEGNQLEIKPEGVFVSPLIWQTVS